MAINRKLDRKYAPVGRPGFLGRGHIAREVVQGEYRQTDPFVVLMDDLLDKKDDQPAGGPHPHAGFETVSLLLEGEMGDEAHQMKSGDLQIMTAGSGIIHTETITKQARMRLLQLWLILPKKDRWAKPRVQDLPLEHVPSIVENGVEIKVYSGSLNGVSSPVQNFVPVIIADVQLKANAATVLHLPASYNTFLYGIEGEVLIGEEKKILKQNETGWLDRTTAVGDSELLIAAGETNARFVLYSGEPQGDAIVSHGPFIGNTTEDITRLYKEYRHGQMQHISVVEGEQRIHY
jgi:quercetin 2,3-dioxygenase